MMHEIILVNELDEAIGSMGKMEAHELFEDAKKKFQSAVSQVGSDFRKLKGLSEKKN